MTYYSDRAIIKIIENYYNFVGRTSPDGDPPSVVAVNGAAANVGRQFQFLSGALLAVGWNG